MGGREAGTNFGVFLRRVELVVVGVKQRSWCQWYCTWLVILKSMLPGTVVGMNRRVKLERIVGDR